MFNRFSALRLFAFTGLVFCILNPLSGQSHFFDPATIKAHIAYLASDKLEGRGTGTKGEQLAAKYIVQQFKKTGIQPVPGQKSYFQEFPFEATGVHGAVLRKGKATNVVGYLNNNAPYTVVIGAHYDHLGRGEDGHSLGKDSKGEIHNGADDNASGVAGVLALAHYFAKNDAKEPFNFLFICFSGEELGLLGSKYFVEHPTYPLEKITAMLNMDMVGRLKTEQPVLYLSGVGTATEWEVLRKYESQAMALQYDSAGIGPSDHTSFYKKNIPVLHFFTGTHKEYHKPEDDVELINAEGTSLILLMMADLIAQLPTDRKLTFQPTRNPPSMSNTRFKVTLGIMPSYSSTVKGVKVEAVLDGKPAQAAGMADGDVIIRLGEYPVQNMQDYMEALSKFEKGMQTEVHFMRGEEKRIATVKF